MEQRGRKTKSAQVTAITGGVERIPEPPKHLIKKQADIWRLVMKSAAAKFIQPEAYPVLVEYCRAVVAADNIAALIDSFELEWANDDEGLARMNRLLLMAEREQRKLTSMAVKLKLTPSSRVDAKVAGRVARDFSAGRKPWQVDQDAS